MSTVRILAESWDVRSALGQHTEALLETLTTAGRQVELALQDPRGVPAAWRGCLARLPGEADLTILQYPIWFPLAETLRETTSTALFWYHGVTPPEQWSSPADRDVLARAVAGTELAWHAHLVVCDSPFGAMELQQHTRYPADRIRVVPLPVDRARFAVAPPPAMLSHLRRRWKLEEQRVLLYVGRIAGNKRVDLLIAALARLRDEYPDLRLLIVGDTSSLPAYRDLTAQLQQQARDSGLTDRVTFVGRVEDVWPYYHLAAVFATASQHEGFGAPVAEAMAVGVPVVASASGALPWTLGQTDSDAKAGLTFAPGDVEALARCIAQVLSDAELRQALIEHGRTRAADFSPAAFASATLQVVDEAGQLARSGQRPSAPVTHHPLYRQADVALRDYRVRSGLPLLGPLVAWLRRNSTTHVKEAYVDRIVEQQVLFNRQLVAEFERLQGELARVNARLAQLEQEAAAGVSAADPAAARAADAPAADDAGRR